MKKEIAIFLEDAQYDRIAFLERYKHLHGRENTVCKTCYDAWPQKPKQHSCKITQSSFNIMRS